MAEWYTVRIERTSDDGMPPMIVQMSGATEGEEAVSIGDLIGEAVLAWSPQPHGNAMDDLIRAAWVASGCDFLEEDHQPASYAELERLRRVVVDAAVRYMNVHWELSHQADETVRRLREGARSE